MTGISLTGRIDLNAVLLRERLTRLGEQVSSGRKGSSYAVLNTGAPKAMDLRGDISRREAYQNTIQQTLAKVQVTQDVLDRIGAIAERFTANTAKLMGATKPEEIQIQAGQARAALVEVANLLNERYSDEYLFGGTATHQPPIPDPDGILTSGMTSGIIDEVALLTSANAATVLANTKALAQSDAYGTTPFSPFLSTNRGWAVSTPFAVGEMIVSNGNIYRATAAGTSASTGGGPAGTGTGIVDNGVTWDFVQPGAIAGGIEGRRNLLSSDNERIEYGIAANRNGAVVSSGETTGSWARDLLRGLASIAGLTPEKSQLGDGYTTFIATVQQGLKSSVNALALERGALGVVEARMDSIRTFHESVTLSLTLQVSEIEEVDMAKTITSFQATQSQLEASYRAMAIAQQLSLTRFL
jgi:flagellin-like hook-associated protein FlgL